MNDLTKFKKSIRESAFGKDSESNLKAGLCIDCKEPAIPKCYSEAGRREYAISGLCEECFDRITDV